MGRRDFGVYFLSRASRLSCKGPWSEFDRDRRHVGYEWYQDVVELLGSRTYAAPRIAERLAP